MSSTGVFGDPPAGMDLSENQDSAVINAVVTLMVIATVFVVLRIVARIIEKGEGLAFDDYLVMLGLLFAHGTAVCCLVSLPYGGGKHLWSLTAAEFTTLWQITFAYVMIYALAVSFTKLSIVMFYRRIFRMNIGLWFCTGLVLSYLFIIMITINVGCTPTSYFWTQYTDPDATGHCFDASLFYFANGIWAMLIDVCILGIPVPIILKLQMPRSQKIAVISILLLGSFVCVASIIRIVYMKALIDSVDLTWAMGGVFIWSCCEPFVGIVCACLPTLAPFFRRWWAKVATRTDSQHLSSANPEDGLSTDDKLKSGKNFHASATGSETPRTNTFGGNKGKNDYRRMSDSPKLRDDDEVELTNHIKGSGGTRWDNSSDDGKQNVRGIVVRKDVEWTTTSFVDDSSSDHVSR